MNPSPATGSRAWLWLGVVMLILIAIWGGYYAGSGGSKPGSTRSASSKVAKYHCPMHPTVVSDRPGSCPICGMDLVPIGEGAHGDPNAPRSGVKGLAVVSIAQKARQLMGLKLDTVEKRPIARVVRTSARIEADETRLWRVTSKVEGWVDKLYVAYTGQEVQKGDPLLTIYSPALVSAQEEYLIALRAQGNSNKTMDGSAGSTRSAGLSSLLSAARRKLELLDVSPAQIDQLARSGKAEKYMTLYAPANGVVTSRELLAGQKIASGDSLMVVADLSVLWGDADIYQSDLPYVKVGMPVTMSLPYWPGKIFTGKVFFVSPTLDGESRTLRARLELPNPEMLLKPGMYGDANLHYEVGEKLSVPASAVMFGGQHTYAFRDLGDGHLVPTEIQLGVRSEGYYEVLGGLNEGDKVVASANFLVDSESNLKAAMEALTPGGAPSSTPGAPGGHQHPTDLAASPASSQTKSSGGISADHYEQVLSAYLTIQEALAADDFKKAHEAARALAEQKSAAAAAQVAAAPNLEEARKNFHGLSAEIITAAHKFGAPANQKLYRLYCPMATEENGGEWLQRVEQTTNPYFGTAMLKCGEIKEEIPHPGQLH